MDKDRFWALIERTVLSAGEDQEVQYTLLQAEVAQLSDEELLGFARLYDGFRVQSYTWLVWGAAYLINGGCSDDGFEYFRAWLISRGQVVFEAALVDPDSLADEVGVEFEEREFEDFLYLPQTVYRTRHDDWLQTGVKLPGAPEGEVWDFDKDEEMKKRYPRLWKYGQLS